MSQVIESCVLNFCDARSDKTYACQLELSEAGAVVNAQWGRRGGTLSSGTKTPTPVDLEIARRIYDRITREKRSKGYVDEPGAQAFTGTADAGRVSGVLPMLLNAVEDEAEVTRLLLDDAWGLQEKFDGERRLLTCDDKQASGANRKGLTVALPSAIVDSTLKLCPTGRTVIDGEHMGERVVAFDLLEHDGIDLRGRPFLERAERLANLVEGAGAISCAELFRGYEAKAAALDAIRKAGGEGVVFRRLGASYTVGRPNSGGDILKLKFVASATVRVAAINTGRRSVAIEVSDESSCAWIGVGNVTIPTNADTPPVGIAIEVQYLYAFLGGSLFQPVYKGARDDQGSEDCTYTQLKFKREAA